MYMQDKVDIFCTTVKYILTLALLATSILISKDVLDKYASKATSFQRYTENITEKESIAIVFYLWPLKKMDYPGSIPYQSYEQWKLNRDFMVAFGIANYRTTQEMIYLNENNYESYISHSSVGKVNFTTLITTWGNYFKLSANVLHVRAPYNAYLQVQFNETIADEDIPSLSLLISSENNSYGATWSDWLDGKYSQIDQVKGFTMREVQPTKIINLKKQSNCQNEAYYACFHSKLIEQDYSHCPRKCLSISTLGKALPICNTVEEFQCSHEIAMALKNESDCLSACTQLDYEIVSGYAEDTEQPNAKRNITFAYKIAKTKMKVEEEFLIHDFVGMLSSIGGALGLFIGFSFLNGVSFILNYFQSFIHRFATNNRR